MKQVITLGGVLAVSLIASYLTWTADDEERGADGVTVLDARVNTLSAIVWEEESKSITLTHPSDKVGEYFQIEFVERKDVTPPAPEPEEPPEGEAEDVPVDPEEGSEEASAEPAPEPPAEAPEPVIEETTRRFAGNTASEDVWTSFAPLMGLRELSVDANTDLDSFGLADPEGKITVTVGGKATVLELGSEAYGTRDRYVRTGGKVFLIDDKILRPLEFANTRLVERALFGLGDEDIERIDVRRDGQARALVQANVDDRAKAFWADLDTPDERDVAAATWIDKLLKLRVQSYVVAADLQGELAPVFTFDVQGGGETWGVAVFEIAAGEDLGIYARSTFNRSLVAVTRSTAQEVIADLDALLQGDEVLEDEEPAPGGLE